MATDPKTSDFIRDVLQSLSFIEVAEILDVGMIFWRMFGTMLALWGSVSAYAAPVTAPVGDWLAWLAEVTGSGVVTVWVLGPTVNRLYCLLTSVISVYSITAISKLSRHCILQSLPKVCLSA